MPQFIVRISERCWLAEWTGDPGRTLVRESAKRFNSVAAARKALAMARKYRQLRDVEIEVAE